MTTLRLGRSVGVMCAPSTLARAARVWATLVALAACSTVTIEGDGTPSTGGGVRSPATSAGEGAGPSGAGGAGGAGGASCSGDEASSSSGQGGCPPPNGGFPCGDESCAGSVESWLAELEEPAGYWHQLSGGNCGDNAIIACDPPCQVTIGPGPACECEVVGSNGSVLLAGPNDNWCSVYGRAGTCLYHGSEFPGCATAEDCNAICADLGARIEADAQATHDTELRTSWCDCQTCRSVVRIDDSCYVDGDLFRPYECACSDEEILALAAAVTECPCLL